MLTRIDHVMICVPHLAEGIETYTRIGFDVKPGGVHTTGGTENAIAFFQDDYLELLGVRAGDENSAGHALLDFLARGGGLRYIALQSDDLGADVVAMRGRGIAVTDVAKAAETYARVLGMPVPRVQRGAVIKADMAVFDLGPTGLTVAQQMEPGPAAEALARRGPGPFQALYKTRSMDAAARWMADHGMPPPARGIRNTGEQAMLVEPKDACGVYVGLFGPA